MPHNKHEIRKAGMQDLQALQAFARRSFAEAYELYNTAANMQYYHDVVFASNRFEQELKGPQSEYYIAWEQGHITGYIKLNKTADQDGPGGIELERIYVSTAEKGKGLGKALLQRAVEAGIAYGKQYLWLGVWERNETAQGFYRHQGFEPFGTHVFMLGTDAQQDILMKKNLRP